MDFYNIPIGFGLALSGNTAAMNRYAHLTESQKQDILNKAHNVRSEKEMYSLVANLANGIMGWYAKSTHMGAFYAFDISFPSKEGGYPKNSK